MTVISRRLVAISGKDAVTFLQGLVSNDVLPLAKGKGIVWVALLSPQGKYLSDFFVVNTGFGDGGSLVLDLPESQADTTLQRLSMYKLRADVRFAPTDLRLSRGVGAMPPDALGDPRHPALGWRLYGEANLDQIHDWDAIRVAHVIPESGIELVPNESYILECGFERLHGVDFRKGCYVGQEVTARMKHKTELRKGLVKVNAPIALPIGTPILTEDGKELGVLYTQSQGQGIAWMRLDRSQANMTAQGTEITLAP